VWTTEPAGARVSAHIGSRFATGWLTIPGNILALAMPLPELAGRAPELVTAVPWRRRRMAGGGRADAFAAADKDGN
jgi:hypothetical protein